MTHTETVRFNAMGQVRIGARLRRRFGIRPGTRVVITITPAGIHLAPVTTALIRRGRGIAKRKPDDKPFDQWWAEYKREERALEKIADTRYGF